ncbi:hypothetical protein ACV3OO_12320 [Clostridium perfringens]|nr:hypothetical protein [Clostridium perfringens]
MYIDKTILDKNLIQTLKEVTFYDTWNAINSNLKNDFNLDRNSLKEVNVNKLIIYRDIELKDLELDNLSFIFKSRSKRDEKISYGFFEDYKEEMDFKKLCKNYIKNRLKNNINNVKLKEDFNFKIDENNKAFLIYIIEVDLKEFINIKKEENSIISILNNVIDNL